MPGRFTRLLIGAIAVALLGSFIATRTILDWKIIPPGWSGIKVNRLVARGITREDVVAGLVFFNPILTSTTSTARRKRSSWRT